MSEQQQEIIVQLAHKVAEKSQKLEAIGIRVLGEIDPRTLSKEEFESSSDVLYHGSAKQFKYTPKYNYSSPEYFTDADGSQTIGEGFYTTDDRGVASNYSRVRQHNNTVDPTIITLLPFQAKILDLRAETDPTTNAPVSKEIFEQWFQFYKSYYLNREGRENLPWNIAGIESDYFQFLIRAKKLDRDYDLRVMLDTAPDSELKGHNYPHPPYVKLFSNFMKQQGFDGLAYIEGGEGADRKNHPSYVFFNLDKVGTYESWQSGKHFMLAKAA